jgi:hypothetical protein
MYIYSLLDHHVSTAHITSVIESVLKLAGKTRSKLPRTSTVNKMNIKRLALYQKQLRGVISAKYPTCLYTYETTRRSWWYTTHSLMVIKLHTKYHKSMSKDTKVSLETKKRKPTSYIRRKGLVMFRLMVFNATLNNISVISWRSVCWWRKPEKTTDL